VSLVDAGEKRDDAREVLRVGKARPKPERRKRRRRPSLVRRRRIDLAELVSEFWVLPPPGSQIASVAKEAFRAKALNYPHTTVITDSPQVRMSVMATGRFLSIFPASALKFSIKRSEIKALTRTE
jgi:hypothetical protein